MTELSEKTVKRIAKMVIEASPTINKLKKDVSTLQKDVRVLKRDVQNLKKDVKTLKEDVRILKEDVHDLRLGQEIIQADLKKILEIVEPALKKTERLDFYAGMLNEHGARLTMTEQAFKHHVTNKKIHLEH